MYKYLFCALFLYASAAMAFDTYRVGSHLLTVGDSMDKISELLGEPESKERVVDSYGNPVGMNWFFNVDGKTIRFLVAGGKIRLIEEIKQ